MDIKRTFDLLERYRELFLQKDDALAGKENGKWITWSTKDYIEQAGFVSAGLLSLGLKKGDIIATISNNRPEWNILDMGMSQAGIVHLPIYATISKEDYEYILNHAQPRLVIVSDKSLFSKINPIAEKVPTVQGIYTIDKNEGINNWGEIVEAGRKNAGQLKDKLKEIRDSIMPEDLVTLIYTSGTTGFPKGVMLSHKNLVTNFVTTSTVHSLDHRHKVLSFLPISHVYERMVNYHFQYKGMSIYYAENMGTIVQDLKDVRPHVFNSVPRLLERVYDRIIGKGKDLPYVRKQIFFWAVNLGLKFELNKINPWYNLQLRIARKLVFSKWKEALGNNIEIIVSGGASLQARLARIFWAADMKVLEGYGLTETSPVIAVNNLTKREIRFGTVGPVIDDVEVKIADDGEILCKGPNVMMGYYKEPELTKEVIDSNGWFHTGDIGILEDGKYLRITDRKKEIFKLSSGKYIAPQVIENKLKESFFIETAMVIGENQKFASALISPNYEFLHNWAGLHDIKFRDNRDLIDNPQTISRIQKEVNELNKNMGQTEQIKRFRLVLDEWSPQSGELSPTLKLKRKVLSEKYKAVIDEIYSVDKGGVD